VIRARDGVRDTIVCQGGRRDRVVADKIDVVSKGCETVSRK